MSVTTNWACDWCQGTTTTDSPGRFPEPTGCPHRGNTNGGLCQWVVMRPMSNRDYNQLRDDAPRPSWCKRCDTSGGPGHWPSTGCRSGGRPGGRVRPHQCTCDSCY